MELLFSKATIPCLRQVKREIQTQEETQELRMPDDYPDIEKVIGTWGQVLLRGKEWRDGSMTMSGGVMTWILYQPEGEENTPQIVEAWIPLQMQWELPQTHRDGVIRIVPMLRSIDARTTSARKLLARVSVSVLGEAYLQDEVEVCTPGELPEDVQLLRHKYPMLLPREAGEKAFDLEEELILPGTCPKIDRLIRFSLQPELIDQKVMSGKLVFRGSAILHMVYLSEQGQLCTWNFDIPFSRYTELDEAYEQEAQSNIVMTVTSLEVFTEPDGKLRLKAGLTGQYVICDTTMVEIGQDAYSTNRPVAVETEDLELPAILQMQDQSVTAEQQIRLQDGQIVDIAFYPDQPQIQKNGEDTKICLTGVFQLLVADDNQQLSGISQRWNGEWTMPTAENVKTDVIVVPSGTPQQSSAESGTAIRADCLMKRVSITQQGIPMISALDIGAVYDPDPDRPCLVLRRASGETLWELAKHHGTTIARIQQANGLETEPEPDRMLLIPMP